MSWWDDHWSEMEPNLIAEAIGVISELALTYLLIGFLLNRREEKRWGPAREIVLHQVATTPATIFNAANQIIRLTFEGGHYPPYDSSQHFLRYANESLSRLHVLVDLNSVALSSELLPWDNRGQTPIICN